MEERDEGIGVMSGQQQPIQEARAQEKGAFLPPLLSEDTSCVQPTLNHHSSEPSHQDFQSLPEKQPPGLVMVIHDTISYMDSSKAKPRAMHLAQRLEQSLLLSYCPETYSWDSHFCISRNLFPSEAETKLISKICHDLSKLFLASRIFERHIGFFMIRKRWFLCILVFSTFSPIHSQTR